MKTHSKETYSCSQLTFRRDLIEPLEDSDRFRVEIPEEAYEMSKAEFIQTFPNVVQSHSYKENGRYHYPKGKVPKKAKRFLVTAGHDAPFDPQSLEPEISPGSAPGPLPLAPPDSALNTGVGAERLVAQDLERQGCAVQGQPTWNWLRPGSEAIRTNLTGGS